MRQKNISVCQQTGRQSDHTVDRRSIRTRPQLPPNVSLGPFGAIRADNRPAKMGQFQRLTEFGPALSMAVVHQGFKVADEPDGLLRLSASHPTRTKVGNMYPSNRD